MKAKLIESIIIDKANLQHIAETGKINGTLLIEINRIMDVYARSAFNKGTDFICPVDFEFDKWRNLNK